LLPRDFNLANSYSNAVRARSYFGASYDVCNGSFEAIVLVEIIFSIALLLIDWADDLGGFEKTLALDFILGATLETCEATSLPLLGGQTGYADSSHLLRVSSVETTLVA